MASLFEYEREAIRIKARRMDIEPEECRKFSVDPNITSFEVLQSILCRAFELPSGDISINYLHSDRTGKEVWTPLLSDWDLDTAILGSADYGLQLQVKLLETGSLGEISSMEKGIVSPVLEYGQSIAKELQPVQRSLQEVAANAKAAGAVQVSGLQGLVSKSSVQASGFFKRHYENTLPGLASKMRTALNIDLEERNEEPTVPPVTDTHFRTFLNKVGQMVSPREFRLAVYRGGLEPSLRKIGWKHLLNVYPAGMTGGERIRHLRELSAGYSQLKSDWMDLVLQGRITDDVKTVINMVRKDVLRTDRQHPFYAGEGNHNVTSLFNILTTYALNHPSVSYCQGMSDLASPILVIMVEESHAYICFTALMNRMKPNFMLDGVAMTTKFQHLSEGLMYYDPEFYTYLKLHMADDLLFCYRWLLLEMKREFPFDLAMKALEVTWSSLPPATADTRIELWETKFSPKMSPSSTDLSKPCQTPYGKVAATIRKQSVDRQLSDNTDVKSSQAKKGMDPRGRVRSANLESDSPRTIVNKSKSSANFNLKRSGFSSGGKKNSIEDGKSTPEKKSTVESKRLEKNIDEEIKKVLDKQGAGDVAEEAEENDALTSGKRVTNLKDFYSLTKPETKKEESEKNPETPVKRKVESQDDDKLPTDSSESTRPQSTEPSSTESRHGEDPFDFVGYSQANNALTIFCNRLPPPTQFGHGNPFLMFLCLSSLLQHRDHIMRNELDYQDIAMFFDKMVRGHDVDRVLRTARRMFAEYLNEDWSPSPQPTVSSQVPNC